MEYILVAIFASTFVLAVFWLVAKTIGRLRIVKNSPTLDDLQDLINPGLETQRNSDHEERSLNVEQLPESIRALADAGDKLAATRKFQDKTGVSLMEAKKR